MRDTVLVGIAALLLLGGGLLLLDMLQDPGPAVGPEPGPDEPVATVATGLAIPWEVAFLPDGDMLVTERPGRLLRLSDSIENRFEIDEVVHTGEGGLLGVALHPDFADNRWIYLYKTAQDPDGPGLENRVVRYRLEGGALQDSEVIIDGIPGAQYHDGGQIAFGPDGYLYITTGDASTQELAQDTSSLAGKILRLNDDGSVPADNPFGNPVYSYGHRNPQGLAWDDQGRLWAPEHGSTGNDELNLIQAGANYGWPVIEGDETNAGMQEPVVHSGSDTWAPGGAVYHDGRVLFAGLRGASIYEAQLAGTTVEAFNEHLSGEFGRLRAITEGPDGYLYATTSNRDGRGAARSGDDRIIRIDPEALTA